jgi:NADP-dependent 3-hydroxy acid dehydrogenase YdfG
MRPPALADRVVVITGASAGIGAATARLAADAGAAVVLSARRADRLADLADAITARGGRALAVAGDVAHDDMRALVDAAVTSFGRLDVMICNAGIGYHGRLDETSVNAMRRLVDVNLMGTFFAAQAALAVMRRQGRGHLIVVSSIAGRRGIGGSSVYGATKAGQIAFVEALRAEFAGTALQASVVLPVSTATEFHDAMARDFGHAVSGVGPRQPAESVARAIVRCMIKPAPEVYPYGPARWLSAVSVIAPGIADRLVQRFTRRRKPHTPRTP